MPGPDHQVACEKDVTMTKMTLGAHPYLLGFEQLERMVEQAAKSGEGYPPFNIEQVSDRGYRITLAVAGFSEDDLSVTVEDRKLVAGRQFMKSFVLADGVDVSGAATENGLLHVDLEKAEPETVIQTITIKKG